MKSAKKATVYAKAKTQRLSVEGFHLLRYRNRRQDIAVVVFIIAQERDARWFLGAVKYPIFGPCHATSPTDIISSPQINLLGFSVVIEVPTKKNRRNSNKHQ